MFNKIKIGFFITIFGIIIFFLNYNLKISANVENFNKYNALISETTFEDDFKDDCIIVTLKHQYFKWNQRINACYFETEKLITLSHAIELGYSEFSFNNINFKNKIIIESLDNLSAIQDFKNIEKIEEYIPIISLKFKEHSKKNILIAIKEVQKLEFVLSAEPSFNYDIVSTSSPNDSFYSLQWGLQEEKGIQIESAWELLSNENQIPLKIGIFEENIQKDHPDLKIIEGNFSPQDTSDTVHGTSVAGVIGAISNNKKGIAGIAQVEIALLNALTFEQSITWAINNNIKIINASFYYGTATNPAPASLSHINAIKNFKNNGGIIIASAGNEGINIDESLRFPGGYSDTSKFPDINNVLCVGAINKEGNRCGFSNYGNQTVQIFAPGHLIYSTMPNSSYGYQSGTSIAAPHVTGVVALLLSNFPNLTPLQLKQVILDSAENITISNANQSTQKVKKLNAYKAVMYSLRTYEIDSYRLGQEEINISKVIDSQSSNYLENNILVNLLRNGNEYGFVIESDYPIKVQLLDKEFNEVNIDLEILNNNCKLCFNPSLPDDNYILKVSYLNNDKSGKVKIKIHCHSYNDHYCEICKNYTSIHDFHSPYNWINYTQHKATCGCGTRALQGHAVRKGTSICILCGGSADVGFVDIYTLALNKQYITINGSYILPNGVIILENEDIEAYINGTLMYC